MQHSWVNCFWAIWLISIEPACAVTVLNGTLGGSALFQQFVYWTAAFEWRFGIPTDYTGIAVRFPLDDAYCYPGYKKRCNVSNEGSLRLDNLTYADQGQYVLIVGQVPSYPSLTVNYWLHVYPGLSAPFLRSTSAPGHHLIGNNVTFYCEAGNQNVTRYSFHRNGKNICSKPHVTCNDSSLYFQRITKSDSGSYTCVIQNPASSNTSNALQLTVSGAPANTSIACEIQPFPEYALFTCSWSGGTPPASINLTFNGTVETGQNIVMKNVTVGNEVQQPELVCQGDQVGRKSECKTTLERPQSTSHSGTPTTSADTGGNATMTVTVSSNTFQPQFSWFFLNPGSVPINTTDKRFTVDFSNTQSTLHITNVTSSDDGTYECRARNVIGSTNFTFRVQVTTPGSSSGGLSGGAIAGIVIGVIAGVALIGVGVFFLVKKL
ncbi:carcinoembryonic antigen-related cell adhesion molecule 1-like [Hyperolius riggenbachi]|uniref:carcinoembryonic antigen-related cell adhesion molecule 1-like n=1 Tax=Hyperolius riggenbachi TaxID=752182 RepID=UPI0035A2C909